MCLDRSVDLVYEQRNYFNCQCDSVFQTISVAQYANDSQEAEATRADEVITPQDREFLEKLEKFYAGNAPLTAFIDLQQDKQY